MSAFAEVVASSLASYSAQTWRWDDFPPLGALVKIQEQDQLVFGLIINSETGSADPSRSAYAYQKTEAELHREQPHIFEFLKTTFAVLPIGYKKNIDTAVTHAIPRTPAKIHSFVVLCSSQEYAAFFSGADFLQVLLPAQTLIPHEQIILALCKELSSRQLLTESFIDSLAENYSLVGGGDYKKLKSLLRQL